MQQEPGTELVDGAEVAASRRLFHRLQRVAHRLQKVADRAFLDAAGVTTAQAAVLAVVDDGERVTQRDVARRLGLNESAVTTLVDRLERAGVLARGRNPADGRAWQLLVTTQGRQALQRVREPLAALNRRIGRALRSDEVASLARCLERIEAEFGDPGGDPGGGRATPP